MRFVSLKMPLPLYAFFFGCFMGFGAMVLMDIIFNHHIARILGFGLGFAYGIYLVYIR